MNQPHSSTGTPGSQSTSPTNEFASKIIQCFGWILLAVEERHQREVLRQALYEVRDTGVLADFGLTPLDVEQMLDTYPRWAQQLAEMAERRGVALDQLDQAIRDHLNRNCWNCRAQGQCRKWLKSGQTSGHEEFCPNSAGFDVIANPADAAAG